jgi:threonine 3-dehydrogenase
MSVLVTSGVDISTVITHRFSYKDYEKGFEAMIGGQTGKVLLDWTTV